MVQLSHLCMITGEILTLTIWTFVSKVMSLALNMLSKIFIAFLSRCMCLLISWLQSQMEDGNFRLSTRFLEHCSVTSPPINQKKVTHSVALIPNFTYKNFFPKTTGSSGFSTQATHSPCLAHSTSFSAPSSDISVCLTSLCIGHKNLCLVGNSKRDSSRSSCALKETDLVVALSQH